MVQAAILSTNGRHGLRPKAGWCAFAPFPRHERRPSKAARSILAWKWLQPVGEAHFDRMVVGGNSFYYHYYKDPPIPSFPQCNRVKGIVYFLFIFFFT